MIAPSFVNFLPRVGFQNTELMVEGMEEAEVLAGAFRRPRGSLRLPVRRRTDPVITALATAPPITASQGPSVNVPGTSSVSLALRIPRLHRGGLVLSSSESGSCDAEGRIFRVALSWSPSVAILNNRMLIYTDTNRKINGYSALN
jgi:hypothetical protein